MAECDMEVRSDAEANNLKPCPYCGSKDIVLSNWGMYRCWCTSCGAKTSDCIRRKDAIEAWNRRLDMVCPCRELEELRAYKADTQKLLAEKEADLVQLSRRCEALKFTIISEVKKKPNLGKLVKDDPSSNLETLLNYAYVKDGEVYLRYANGKTDVNLAEYICHLAAEKGCGHHTKEDVLNGDVCMACDCEVAILNTVAIQAAELRNWLKKYEDMEGK